MAVLFEPLDDDVPVRRSSSGTQVMEPACDASRPGRRRPTAARPRRAAGRPRLAARSAPHAPEPSGPPAWLVALLVLVGLVVAYLLLTY